MTTSKSYQRLFHIVCISVTAALIGRCIQKSYLDEDETLVEYRKFNADKDMIYPSISLCIHHPYHIFYNKDIWDDFSDKNTSDITSKGHLDIRQDYLGFLRGKFDNKHMHRVDYDTVSTNLETYLLALRVELKSNEQIVYRIVNGSFTIKEAYKEIEIERNVFNRSMFSTEEINSIANPNLYTSKRETHQKCFSFDTPFIRNKQVKQLTLHLKGMIFQGKGIIPDKEQFTIHYHYPHQTTKSISTLDGWKSQTNDKAFENENPCGLQHETNDSQNKKTGKQKKKNGKQKETTQKKKNSVANKLLNYMRRFYLASVEVVKRRNKSGDPCIGGNYDNQIIDTAMRAARCKSSVILTNDSFPICRSEKSFIEFEAAWKIKEHPPPCNTLQSLYEWHGEGDDKDIKKYCKKYRNCGKTGINSNLIIQIVFTNDFYKEVVHIKKYTFEALIGNTGGYVGK